METAAPEKPQSFRDTIATVDQDGQRVWIYPKLVKGVFYKYRTYLSWFFLALLFSGPFIRVHGHPLMLFNVLERKFIIFGLAFWPQDFNVLVVGVIAFIVFIVLFTAVFGRLFCGWVCPQTIFMEMVFRKIEYWIEGDAAQQRKLAGMPWNAEKIRKRSTKFLLFFSLSFLIANTFLAYIIGTDDLFKIILDDPRQHLGGLAAITIFTGIFFFVYWWFREQACLIVCPYGRLQGVLLDKNSINITYDFVRGEKRDKKIKNRPEDAGDCIDCKKCVAVCPTGIDIRNGTQLECVNCTNCIDACDEIMVAMNKPQGLIRYTSYNNIVEKTSQVFTTRVKAYTVVLSLLLTLFFYLLLSRPDTETTILRAKGQLYTEQGIYYSNLYTLKSINKTFEPVEVTFKIKEFPSAKIRMVGSNLSLSPQGLAQGAMFVDIPKVHYQAPGMKISIEVYAKGKKVETISTRFTGPNQ